MPTRSPSKPEPLAAIRQLWESGLPAAQPDSRLLARFLDGPGEAAELAFTTLVERHGPSVRRTCLATLGDPHDADDAAQATFLVLARRAGSIRKPDSLGPWLIGVARRVARKAHAQAIRRRQAERRLAENRPPIDSANDPTPTDPSVFEELARLPEKYRAAVTMVDLRGRSQSEAAAELGWPLGTLQTRLHRDGWLWFACEPRPAWPDHRDGSHRRRRPLHLRRPSRRRPRHRLRHFRSVHSPALAQRPRDHDRETGYD